MGRVTASIAQSPEGSGRRAGCALLREWHPFAPCPNFLCLCWAAAHWWLPLALARMAACWEEILSDCCGCCHSLAAPLLRACMRLLPSCSAAVHVCGASLRLLSHAGRAMLEGDDWQAVYRHEGLQSCVASQGSEAPEVPGIPSCWAECARMLPSSCETPSPLRFSKSTHFFLSQRSRLLGSACRFYFSISLISSTSCNICLHSWCGLLELVD